MGQQQSFAGAAEATQTTENIGSTDDTIPVAATTNWPNTDNGPFVVTINRGKSDEEKALIASYTSSLLTVADDGRGYDGTTAQTHQSGATVECTIDAAWFEDVSSLLYAGTTQIVPDFNLAGFYGTTITSSFGVVEDTPITIYEPDGETKKTLYTDQTKGTTVSNPIDTDSNGYLTFFTDPGLCILSVAIGDSTYMFKVLVANWPLPS